MMKDPDAMQKAAEMMENMSEEDLEAMGQMSGMNGMPKVDPKMAKQAAAMMKNMDKDAMKGMMDMAAKMKAQGMDPSSMANPNDPATMAKMAEQMKNPGDAKHDHRHDEERDAGAAQGDGPAGGMNMSDEQAAQTAQMMKNISPETMQRMMKVGSALNGVFTRFRSTYQWCMNKLMAEASPRLPLDVRLVRHAMGILREGRRAGSRRQRRRRRRRGGGGGGYFCSMTRNRAQKPKVLNDNQQISSPCLFSRRHPPPSRTPPAASARRAPARRCRSSARPPRARAARPRTCPSRSTHPPSKRRA